MRLLNIRPIVAVVVLLSMASQSFAQQQAQPQAPQLPTFLIERSQRSTTSAAPDTSMKSADWLSSVMKDGMRMPGIGDALKPQGQMGPPAPVQNQMPQMEGQKRSNFPSLVSAGSFGDLRMGMASMNMLRTSRSGPIVIENMALALVEPAMQKGDVDSAKETSDMYSNLLQSLNGFLGMADANPETREWVLQALNNCVVTQMATLPAAAALSFCLYDREVPMQQGVATFTGPGFKLSQHPDIAQAQAQNTAGVLCLDDLALNLSQVSSGQGNAPLQVTPRPGGSCIQDLQNPDTQTGGANGTISPDQMRKYINSRVGCFCNQSQWDQLQGQQQNDLQAGRTLNFEYRPPPVTTDGRTRLQEDFFNNFKFVYDTLMTVMKNYCTHQSTALTAANSNPLTFGTGAGSWQEKRFWEATGASAPRPEDIVTLSMDGFTFDPQIGDALFFLFRRSKLSTAAQGLVAGDCAALDSAGTAMLDTLLSNPNATPDYLRFMFKYALTIARGQYLGSLSTMQQFMTNLTANSWVRGKIYENYVDKIVKAARVDPTDDRSLSAMTDDNVKEMQRWRGQLFTYLQNQVGSGGKNITGQLGREKAGSSQDVAQ